jgi:hypothetical protein
MSETENLRAMLAAVERLADSIHGDSGWEHNSGCEGEPDCFACIELDLRAILTAAHPVPADDRADLDGRAGKDAAAVAAVRALGMNWARLSAMAMDDEVREWTSAASRSVLAALDVVDHPPCCGPTCQGTACWDCKGTGHPHDVAPALDVAPPTTDLDAVRRKASDAQPDGSGS